MRMPWPTGTAVAPKKKDPYKVPSDKFKKNVIILRVERRDVQLCKQTDGRKNKMFQSMKIICK
jgi:hypothetical protein